MAFCDPNWQSLVGRVARRQPSEGRTVIDFSGPNPNFLLISKDMLGWVLVRTQLGLYVIEKRWLNGWRGTMLTKNKGLIRIALRIRFTPTTLG